MVLGLIIRRGFYHPADLQVFTRGQSGGQPTEQRSAIEAELSQAVSNLVVTVEAYPELKSNTNFVELQRELTSTEDRIAAARRFYNANVRDYNTKVESVPSNLLAKAFGFRCAAYFALDDARDGLSPQLEF